MDAAAHKLDVDEWQASLSLSFESAPHRTVLRRKHTGPLLVQRPFYPEGDTCHTVLLHPPAGVVGGDQLNIEIDCDAGSSALVTTPGATRFYGSDGRSACQNLVINVRGGSLEWLPMETIYFNNCVARQSATITLDPESRYIGWEISCFGRTAGDFPFVTGSACVALKLELDGSPLLHERLQVDGERDINRASGMRGMTVSGTLVALAPELDVRYCVDQLRNVLPADRFVATQIDGLVVVRYLGCNSEQARNGFINAWGILRPHVLRRPVCVPRIWAT